jgi:hypothetical protein
LRPVWHRHTPKELEKKNTTKERKWMGFPPDLVSVTTQQRSLGDTRERSTESVMHFAEQRSPTNLSKQFISFCVVAYTTRREESSRKRVAHQCRLTLRIQLRVLWLSCEFPHLDLLATYFFLFGCCDQWRFPTA